MDFTRRCIYCSMRLAHQRWRTLQDASEAMVNNLRARISPTPVSPENSLCSECFANLQQLSENVEGLEPALGHRSICCACGISILRARTHLVHHNCPEINVIIRWTLPHLVCNNDITAPAPFLDDIFNEFTYENEPTQG